MIKFILRGTAILFSIILLTAFQKEPDKSIPPQYPDTRFLVFSDPHYYDPSLGTEGAAFEEYLNNDRKLLKESSEILSEAFRMMKNDSASFILIPGDLTKDGTMQSHRRFSESLSELELSGKQIYVVPGNHDVSNPHAYSYKDSLKIKVDNVSPVDFKNIYHNFGYGEAIYSDTSSLSYIVEPEKGMWLFALDACRYSENEEYGHPVTGGKFNESTLKWINEKLDLAHQNNKTVIGMMHHGILEHYDKQSKFFGEYIVEKYEKVSETFARKGLKIMFTGHYHAQDIVSRDFRNGSFIFDIETGSMVTYPCPFRSVSIRYNTAEIKTYKIETIPSHPENFQEFAQQFVWSGIEGIAKKALVGYKLKEKEAAMLSGQVADAFVAHYAGDEITPEKPFVLDGVSSKGKFLIGFKKKLVWNLWNDTFPADNDLSIDLSTGKVL